MSSQNAVSIGAVLGASGSGKSSLLKLELLAIAPARRVIWDPKREYGRYGAAFSSIAELYRAVFKFDRKAWRARDEFRAVFHPAGARRTMRKQFDVFCQVAAAAGNCWCVADELADVTEPNWAPEGWEILTRQGRHAGVTIRGASQRPAEIDKSFLGNASHLAVFRLNAEGDIDRCAKLLDVPAADVRQLLPLAYITRDMLTGKVKKNSVSPADLARLT